MSNNLDCPVLKHTLTGEVITIDVNPYSMGRGLGSNYVIANKAISRHHCMLIKEDDGWKLKDMSANGTMINQKQLRHQRSSTLKDNDIITLFPGIYVYKFLTKSDEIIQSSHKPPTSEQQNGETGISTNKDAETERTEDSVDVLDIENYISDEDLCNLADNVLSQVEVANRPDINHEDNQTESYSALGSYETDARELDEIRISNSTITNITDNTKTDSDNVPPSYTNTDGDDGAGENQDKTSKPCVTGTADQNSLRVSVDCSCITNETITSAGAAFVSQQNSHKKIKIETYQNPDAISEVAVECGNQDANIDVPTVSSLMEASPQDTSTSANEVESPKRRKKPLSQPQNLHESQEAGSSKQSSENVSESSEKLIDQANHIGEMENELQCAICSELFIQAVTLKCSHTFCKFCIYTWKKNKAECPICRTRIVSMTPTLVLDNVIKMMIENSTEEVKEQRSKMVEERMKFELPAARKHPVKWEKMSRNPRGGRGRQRGRRGGAVSRNTGSDSVGTTITISSSSSSSDSSMTSSDDTSDDDWETRFVDYDDRPRGYYGGYGRCFKCWGVGHWANGCPY